MSNNTVCFDQEPIPAEQFLPQNIEDMPYSTEQQATYIIDNIKSIIPKEWYIGVPITNSVLIFDLLRNLNITYTINPLSNHVFGSSPIHTRGSKEIIIHMENGIINFTFNNILFMLFVYTVQPFEANINTKIYIACSNFKALQDMLKTIYEFGISSQSRFMVFDGQWSFGYNLQDGLTDYTWDNLIMKTETKDAIREDVDKFFSNGGDIYHKLGIPYKRGALFIGPPGCGKSLTAKIIANEFKYTFIYVMALRSTSQYEEQNIKTIFTRARDNSPSIILFEDIDALMTTSNSEYANPVKACFLNTMDGFYSNDGVFVIATTNKPQNIDVALLNRPSRFDRKYEFCMPNSKYREMYLQSKLRRITNDISEVQETIHKIAQSSIAHSYAMLQELVLTASYDYISNGKNLSQSLFDAAEITKKQVMLGKSTTIIEKMNDTKTLGLRNKNIEEDDND